MGKSDQSLSKQWTLEGVKELYSYLQGNSVDKITQLYAPKLSPDEAFSVIYILQEHFEAISDEFEQCAKCKELYDTSYGGNHYDNVGINLCDGCEDYVLYRVGNGDYNRLAEYVKKWWVSIKGERK